MPVVEGLAVGAAAELMVDDALIAGVLLERGSVDNCSATGAAVVEVAIPALAPVVDVSAAIVDKD